METSATDSIEPPPFFRPSKKRKIYRQRETNEPTSPVSNDQEQETGSTIQSLDELIASASASAPTVVAHDEGSAVVGIAEILRLRKNKKRAGGVEFRGSHSRGAAGRDEAGAKDGGAADEEQTEERVGGSSGLAVRRFAPQMGTVGVSEVDKHMAAYIDSEMAKRRSESMLQQQQQHVSQASNSNQAADLHTTIGEGAKDKDPTQRQPATLGKLLEIDLGDEVRERNRAKTERARRRLDGEAVLDDEDDEDADGKKKKPVKVRLGRDGKPWRGRKRRGSDDVKRDQLVEAVLRENRLDIYEEPTAEAPPTNDDDDQAADDRMAEAFRKEFMDSVSARQKKKAAPAPPTSRNAAVKKEEELLKGPKLGGSRSARAAMRENLLKAAKK